MSVVSCEICHQPFKAKPYWLKRGWGRFCSAACHHKGMNKGKEVPCALCGVVSYKQRKQLLRSKSGKFFCSKRCQTIWRNQTYVGDKHLNYKTGEHSYRPALARNDIPKVCRLCKTTDIRVLAVHHIDKDRKNNKLSNLAWLCHNCHFLVHHYENEREKFMPAMV